MAIILGKLKCHFCKGKSGVITSVHEYGMYGEVDRRIYFHNECLEAVEVEPEKFGHAMVDMAIHIHDLKEDNISKTNKHLTKIFKEKVEKLQRKNFERMMPSK